jgi:GTP-binding protein HflX
LSDTVGFIRKLPHGLIESFKSTLDEIRESDIVLHVVDISHPEFEEQIDVVNETLSEIGASQIKSILIFNKIDNYTYVEKDEDDLTEMTRENISLDDLKNTWFAKSKTNTIFISAKTKENLDELRQLLYKEIRNIHNTIYPYNRVP